MDPAQPAAHVQPPHFTGEAHDPLLAAFFGGRLSDWSVPRESDAAGGEGPHRGDFHHRPPPAVKRAIALEGHEHGMPGMGMMGRDAGATIQDLWNQTPDLFPMCLPTFPPGPQWRPPVLTQMPPPFPPSHLFSAASASLQHIADNRPMIARTAPLRDSVPELIAPGPSRPPGVPGVRWSVGEDSSDGGLGDSCAVVANVGASSLAQTPRASGRRRAAPASYAEEPEPLPAKRARRRSVELADSVCDLTSSVLPQCRRDMLPASAAIVAVIEHRVHVYTEDDKLEDGLRWRKYGQKLVNGSVHPRSYYKCTTPGCAIQKHVEQSSEDPRLFVITYHADQTRAMKLRDELGAMPSVERVEVSWE